MTKIPTFAVEAARYDDVQALVRLLGDNVPHVSAETVWQVPWNWHHYRVIRAPSGDLIGAGSLQPLACGRLEIRGLVVHRDWRKSQLATSLMKSLLLEARRRGIDIVCITRRPSFFRRFGFNETSPTWLDARRRQVSGKQGPPIAASVSKRPRIAMTRGSGAQLC